MSGRRSVWRCPFRFAKSFADPLLQKKDEAQGKKKKKKRKKKKKKSKKRKADSLDSENGDGAEEEKAPKKSKKRKSGEVCPPTYTPPQYNSRGIFSSPEVQGWGVKFEGPSRNFGGILGQKSTHHICS